MEILVRQEAIEKIIQMNIAVMRSFVKIPEMLSAHKDLARKLVCLHF
ncbi:MAG: hypothetical protein HZA16_11285 [Nitrospirae bacterium]|nr:hypothetical protein [Nitrospirota bacterium]